MLQEGFGEVYHLKGGILKYLERIPERESRWEGRCFVFDRRRAMGTLRGDLAELVRAWQGASTDQCSAAR